MEGARRQIARWAGKQISWGGAELDRTSLQACEADLDALGLPDPVRPCHGLHIVLRVPVRVHDDTGVGRREVDPEACGDRER